MNGTIMKTIILTTRTTGDELKEYAKKISTEIVAITINNTNYQRNYKKINIQNTSEKIIILLDGFQLNQRPILISNLQKFDEQQNQSDKVSAFLELLNRLAKQENFELNENLIFAIHWGGVDPLESHNYTENFKKWIEKYHGKVKFILTFWTTGPLPAPAPDKEIDKKLQQASPRVTVDEFEKWFDILKARALPITIKISLLKHRIAHLFLPLDIDLQGISEVKEGIKEVYLKEVLQEKNGNGKPKDKNGNPAYYRQKLADLWYMVVKKDFGVQKINGCEIVTPRSSAELLGGDKAIIDLISEKIKAFEEEIKKSQEKEKELNDKVKKIKHYWSLLLKICGLKLNNNAPFYANKISYDENSPILQFMCLMDSKIIKKDQISTQDVEEILNYFSKLNDDRGWKVTGANPERINSFHDWFCALMDCLDKIREKLKDEQGK